MKDEIIEVYIDDIIPNRFQPREKFNDESINELANSIKRYGVIQPLVLRKIGDKFEIIAGERRYKASSIAGLEKVPAVIKNLNDSDSAEVALIENIQREDLTIIEKARSYNKLLIMSGDTQEFFSKKLGISQSSLSNALRLLALDDKVQTALLERKISERHARSLLQIKDKTEQIKLLERIINERLTVRSLDMIIKGEDSTETPPEGEPKTKVPESLGEILIEEPEPVAEEPEMKPEPVIEKQEIEEEIPKIEPISEPNIDIIQNQAVDIDKPVEKPDFDMLLKPTENEEEPIVDFPNNIKEDLDAESPNMALPEEPEPINIVTPELEPPMEPIITMTPEPESQMTIPEPMPVETETIKPVQPQEQNTTNTIRTAINTLRQSVETIEKYGFNVEVEELDLEEKYQFIININKETEKQV